LNLRRAIVFQPNLPAIPPLEIVAQRSPRWEPRRGFSAVEQSVDHNLEEYRWAYGPAALAEIVVETPGRYSILIAYRNPHEGQCLNLRLNGALLGTHELPNTGWDSSRVLVQDVAFDCNCNLLHFEFSRWYPVEVDARPLAVIITEILVEKVGEWDQIGVQPTSHQALGAVWSEKESLQVRIRELGLKIAADI
jgi:hypothetical protein